MQVTGETLERAMAVLGGNPTVPEPEPEPGDEPAAGCGPDEQRVPDEARTADRTDAADATGPLEATGTTAATSPTDPPHQSIDTDDGAANGGEVPRQPRRRSHLRGL